MPTPTVNVFAAATLLGFLGASPAWSAQTATENIALSANCEALQSGAGSSNLPLLLQAVPACQKDARFLAHLGQRLNREGRFAEAADHLERALLLDPGQPEVTLSYANALTGLADWPTAQALLEQLLQDATMPPTLRATLQRQRDNLAAAQASSAAATALAAAGAGWQSRFTLGARVGYDSNLLGAPNIDSLTLTFAEQTLQLALDETYLARAGNYARLEALLDLSRVQADGSRWSVGVSLRSGASPGLAAAGTSQLDVSVEHQTDPSRLRGRYVAATATRLQPQIGSPFVATGVAAGWNGAWQTAGGLSCEARAGLDAQDRRYTNLPVLSGRYTGVMANMGCLVANGPQWGLGLRSGQDRALGPDRPGGNQTQNSLRATTLLPLPAVAPTMLSVGRSALSLVYEYATQADSSIYSEFLESGRSRTVRRHSARAELQHNTTQNTQWVLGLDWLAQTSTLPLFGQRSWGLGLGYRAAW